MKGIIVAAWLLGQICLPLISQNLDIKILRSIDAGRPLSLQPTFLFVSNTVYPVSIATPIAFIIAGRISGNQTMLEDGLASSGSIIINESVTTIFKYAVNRQRPYNTYPDIIPQSYDTDPSFPSGHTSAAFCTATSLSLMCPKWYVIVPSYAWATSVGYSRLFLGMHYPSDVLAGAVIGAGSAFIGFKIRQWIDKKYAKKHQDVTDNDY
jgi:membrane-associated phospholipid phosphatase